MTAQPFGENPRLRASDADRDRAASVLNGAMAEGRLTVDEHADRLDALVGVGLVVGIGEHPDHRRLLRGWRPICVDLHQAEEDDGDVVAAAGLVGGDDQPLGGGAQVRR